MIEIRDDLIRTPPDQERIARRLADALAVVQLPADNTGATVQ